MDRGHRRDLGHRRNHGPRHQRLPLDRWRADRNCKALSARDWTVDTVESVPAAEIADWTIERQREGVGTLTVRLAKALSPARPVRLVISARQIHHSRPRRRSASTACCRCGFLESAAVKHLVSLHADGPYEVNLSDAEQLKLDRSGEALRRSGRPLRRAAARAPLRVRHLPRKSHGVVGGAETEVLGHDSGGSGRGRSNDSGGLSYSAASRSRTESTECSCGSTHAATCPRDGLCGAKTSSSFLPGC